jgi:predicted kinase
MSFYVIIRGPLGCGKSTISKKISETLNAKYFAVDRVLDDYDLGEEKEAGYVSQKSFIKANEIIAPEVEKFLHSGKPVVFDGNFYWRSQIDDLIGRLDFPHYVFTLKAPLETCIERDSSREKTHGVDAASAVYKKSTEFNYGIVIDVNRPIDDCLTEIISHLPKN